MGLILWLAFGAIAGGIAKWLYPGKCPQGWVPTIGLGVIGSLAGGLPFGDAPAGLIGSVIGAVACMFVYSLWSDDR
jgi:uncharacterized membrane protein YeaQ/YmgE (transglycosylase-associated protein family)